MSSSLSSGVGGNVGGPQVPLQRDLETSAWTQINKQLLGIVDDSLEQSFTQMNPKYTSGYYGGYKSSEGQPLLDHSLDSGRVGQGLQGVTDEMWKETYDQLLQMLPDNLKQQFIAEGTKPFDERSGVFVALDNLLTLVAKVLTSVSQLSQPESIGKMDEEKALLYQVLPFTALRGAISQSVPTVQSATSYVQNLFSNNYFLDTYTNALTNVGNGAQDLQQIASEIKQSGITQETTDKLTRLSTNLNAMKANLDSTNLGGNFLILNSLLNAMALTATSVSQYSSGSGSLFLGLSLATMGINTSSNTQSGIIGNSLATVLDNLSSGLIAKLLPNSALGNQQLLQMAVSVGFSTLIGLAALAIQPGFGIYPNKDPTYEKSSRFFAFELALIMLNSSSTLNQVITPFLQAANANATSTQQASTILSQAANLFMILAGTQDGHQNPAYLIESLENHFQKGIATATDVVNQETNQTESDTNTSIALQQSQIALNNKDYEGFLDAFKGLLEESNISLENLNSDINQISQEARNIASSLGNNDNQQITAVVNFI